jgi:cell division protein ZapE
MSSHPVEERYLALVAEGRFSSDPAQLEVAQALDRVLGALKAKAAESRPGALARLLGRGRPASAPVKGLYVHGDVGRGKTMLMDLFHAALPGRRKRRAHFNEFMADVHDRIQKQRERIKAGEVKQADPVGPVARKLAEEASVLCFDEFSVTDIADAMILSRLFSALFEAGVTLVATSNVAPENLYRDGLNRGLFLPFLDILSKHVTVMSLDSPTDYRRLKLDRLKVYVTPLGPEADRRMDETWQAMTEGRPEERIEFSVKGHRVAVPRAAGAAARFGFAEICEVALGARDYLALADRFDTIFIDHIPVMDDSTRNAAKRFILLVDTLYDRGVRLVASAAAAPEALYRGRIGAESFEFARTASRLTEMQSAKWLSATAAAGKQAAE